MKTKKIFACLLAVCMLLGLLTACNTAPSPSATPAASPSEAASPSPTEAASPSPTVDTSPVTLTIMLNSNQITTPGVQTDPVAQQILADTGITMDVTDYEGTDFTDQFNAMLAAGDLPDIVCLGSINPQVNMANAINAGAFVNLNDLIQSHGQNFLTNPKLSWAVDYTKKYYSNGTGDLYAVPAYVGNASGVVAFPGAGTFLRWDLYKQLGYPAITSDDDYLKVLGDMQAQFPTAANGQKAYAASLWTDWGPWATEYLAYNAGYALTSDALVQVDISDNSTVSLFTDPNSQFWHWEQWYNKAFQQGLLDPDSATQTYNDWTAKVDNGQVYSAAPGWYAPNQLKSDVNAGFGYVDTNPASNKALCFTGNDGGGYYYAISTNCKNPERAMDLLNYLASYQGGELIANGVEGQAYTVDANGNRIFSDALMTDYWSGMDGVAFAEKWGVGKYDKLNINAPGELDPTYNSPMRIYMSVPFLTGQGAGQTSGNAPMLQDYLDHEGLGNTMAGQGFVASKQYTSYLRAPMMPAMTDDQNTIITNATNYITENWIKVIMSKDDASFAAAQAQFIKDLTDMGLQTIVDQEMSSYGQGVADLDTIGQ